MPHLLAMAGCLMMMLLASPIDAAGKKEARVVRIGDGLSGEIRIRPSLATADTCLVRHDSGAVWKIDGWVFGAELYKEYLDPAATCTAPYPFMVTEIAIQMYFETATPLYVSADIEAADNSTPGCPVPGVLLAISSEWQTMVPAQGLYEIWIPLDTPYAVTGPFFAGIYIGNSLAPEIGAAVITDSFPVLCTSYNIWDSTIGFIDLNSDQNEYFTFPGRMLLYAVGITGGSGGEQPEPALTILAPTSNDTLLGSAGFWVWDTSGSDIIDYVSFEYSSGGAYTEAGRDYDGYRPLRDGLNNSDVGDGFSLDWDFSSLSEGVYTVRATAFDTLGRSSSDSAVVYLEPTPPVPTITSPSNGSDFCSPLELLMSSSDEDLNYVDISRHDARTGYSTGMVTLNQFTLGDDNGNPDDGNPVAGGEFGDYYSGPVAAAIAVRVWFDRGFEQVMREGYDILSVDTVAERLATRARMRENLGTYDENLLQALQGYAAAHGSQLLFDFHRNPDYFLLRRWVEDEQRVVVLALGGTPGIWLAVDGFTGWEQPDGSYMVRVSDPRTGSMVTMPMRAGLSTGELLYNGTWQRVDLLLSILGWPWDVSRQLLGADFVGADGWSYSWIPTGLAEDSLYFFIAGGHDVGGLAGFGTVLLKYNCSDSYVAGDYTQDDETNVVDLNLLIQFVAYGGEPPDGGAGRADANCDGIINIADVVYYMNFLFGNAGPPCY
ncbi:MAG: dockerin type I repeat-containing protein [bacterium]